MHDIRKQTLPETRFIPTHLQRISICHRCKIARIMIRRKININLLTCIFSQFHSRNHIAISRNNNGSITILFICIRNNLRSNTHIRFFFFVCTDDIIAIKARNRFLQVFTKYQLKLWIFLIRLKESILVCILIRIFRSCRKIFDCYKFLMWTHKFLKQIYNVKPIITSPFRVIFQTIIKIEAIHIYDNPLSFHHS